MLIPFPSLSGHHFRTTTMENVDSLLANNKPVIVHVSTGTATGHWIVLVKKDGDNYIINDPWEGPDKKLTDFYSWYQLNRPYYLE